MKTKKYKNIIDIREKEDYDRIHLDNSINYPYSYFSQHYQTLLNKNTNYYLICYEGNLSKQLAKEMRKNNFKVKSISGGIKKLLIQ